MAGFPWLGSCHISNERLSIGIYYSIIYTLLSVCVLSPVGRGGQALEGGFSGVNNIGYKYLRSRHGL
jgi:hypothetical protein